MSGIACDCPKCGTPLPFGKKLCSSCGRDVRELTRPREVEEVVPTVVKSNTDASKVWGRVVATQSLADPPAGVKRGAVAAAVRAERLNEPGSSVRPAEVAPETGGVLKPSSVAVVLRASRAEDEGKGTIGSSKAAGAPVSGSAQRSSKAEPVATTASAKPPLHASKADVPVVAATAAAVRPLQASGGDRSPAMTRPLQASSGELDPTILTATNVAAKQALGLQKCTYCTKYINEGEGETFEDKHYHVAFCLAKATALLKYANQEAELKKPARAANPCDPVINEILKTEEAYVSDLGIIVSAFLEPCRAANALPDEDVRLVFANVEALKKLHETVVVGLHAEAKKPPRIQNWGLVFKTYEASFRNEYQVYTKNQGKARARRLELEQNNARFKAFLAGVFGKPEIKMPNLNSYLIKPVQRICKYPLLLRELCKAFEKMGVLGEEAKGDLAIAMSGMSEVLKKANDYMATVRGPVASAASGASAGPAASSKAAAAAAPTTATAPAVVLEHNTANMCTFCHKKVAPAERRMENGLLYHSELCFNRDKAAEAVAKAKAAPPPKLSPSRRGTRKFGEGGGGKLDQERRRIEEAKNKDNAAASAGDADANGSAKSTLVVVRNPLLALRASHVKPAASAPSEAAPEAEVATPSEAVPAVEVAAALAKIQEAAPVVAPVVEAAPSVVAEPPVSNIDQAASQVESDSAASGPLVTAAESADSAPVAVAPEVATSEAAVSAPESDDANGGTAGDDADNATVVAAAAAPSEESHVETFLAAIDVEGDLDTSAMVADETVVPDAPAAEGSGTSAAPQEEEDPAQQFSTLRKRPGAEAAAASTGMPREVMRTLRIVEESRQVFSTIRRSQLAEDKRKREALEKRAGDAGGVIGGAGAALDIATVARMVAEEERAVQARADEADKRRKARAQADSSGDSSVSRVDGMALAASLFDDSPREGAEVVALAGSGELVSAANAEATVTTTSTSAAEEPRVKKKTSVLGSLFRRRDKVEKVDGKRSASAARRDKSATAADSAAADQRALPTGNSARSSGPLPVAIPSRPRTGSMQALAESPDSSHTSVSSTPGGSAAGSLAGSPESSGTVTPSMASGFHVGDANALHCSVWPEPLPNDAVYRLAQTAVQVAHEAARITLVELRNENLFEVPDVRDLVVVDHGKVVAATLPKIIQQVTLAEAVDVELLMTFLHVYNALMLPTDLVALIRARWHMQPPSHVVDENEQHTWRQSIRRTVRARIVLMMRLWIKWHPRSFRASSPLLEQMLVFLDTDVIPKLKEQAESIKRDMLNSSQVGPQPQRLGETLPPIRSDGPPDGAPTLCTLHPAEVARQLALSTFDVYIRISSSELLQKRWVMAHKTLLSPNVLNMQQHEHRLKNLFATHILAERGRKNRAVTLARVIVIALECLKLHNFSGVVAIVKSLEDPSIRRLQSTWKLIPEVLMTVFQTIVRTVDEANAYTALLDEMASTAVPGIPYMGAVLTKIADTEDRLPYVLQEQQGAAKPLICSLSKVRLVGTLINQIMRFQTHAFNFERVEAIQDFFSNSKVIDDLALLRVSLTLEPEDD